jgi:SAM-dependent methyltransferase
MPHRHLVDVMDAWRQLTGAFAGADPEFGTDAVPTYGPFKEVDLGALNDDDGLFTQADASYEQWRGSRDPEDSENVSSSDDAEARPERTATATEVILGQTVTGPVFDAADVEHIPPIQLEKSLLRDPAVVEQISTATALLSNRPRYRKRFPTKPGDGDEPLNAETEFIFEAVAAIYHQAGHNLPLVDTAITEQAAIWGWYQFVRTTAWGWEGDKAPIFTGRGQYRLVAPTIDDGVARSLLAASVRGAAKLVQEAIDQAAKSPVFQPLVAKWRYTSPFIELGCGAGDMTPYLAEFIAPRTKAELDEWKSGATKPQIKNQTEGKHWWPRYWAADGLQRPASIAQMWFAFFCRKARGFKAKQVRAIRFMSTELIHHLGGSWRALYLRLASFREDFRKFGIIFAFHALDAVPPWSLEECFDLIYEALTVGGLFIIRFNAAEDNGVAAPFQERWPDGKLRNDKLLSIGQWRLPITWLTDLIVGEHKRFTPLLSRDFEYRDENGAYIWPPLGRVHEMAFVKNKVDSKAILAAKQAKRQ